MKRWWRFRTQPSLFADFLFAKYCSKSHPVAKKKAQKDLQLWKNILLDREKVESRMIWKINSGHINFFWDNWSGLGDLANLIPGIRRNSKIIVKDFIIEGKWDIYRMGEVVPENLFVQLCGIDIGENDMKDYATWTDIHDGIFTSKSSWKVIRQSSTLQPVLNKLWHKSIPFKCSFLLWRLYMGKIPFNDVILRKFGIRSESKCYCCRMPIVDFTNHSFIEGEIPCYIWEIYGAPLSIRHQKWSFKRILNMWGSVNSHIDVHKTFLQLTPIFICWEIWRQWTSCKYDSQKKFNKFKMEHRIFWNITTALRTMFPNINLEGSWVALTETIERYRPKVNWRQVVWSKPPINTIKVNTNGSFDNNTGKAGISGVVRDHNGDFIMAFSISIQCSSNNIAKAVTAYYGILWSTNNGFTNIHLELDSLIIADMLKSKDTGNLKMKRVIQDTIKAADGVELHSLIAFVKPIVWLIFLLKWPLVVELVPSTPPTNSCQGK